MLFIAAWRQSWNQLCNERASREDKDRFFHDEERTQSTPDLLEQCNSNICACLPEPLMYLENHNDSFKVVSSLPNRKQKLKKCHQKQWLSKCVETMNTSGQPRLIFHQEVIYACVNHYKSLGISRIKSGLPDLKSPQSTIATTKSWLAYICEGHVIVRFCR